MLRCYFQQEQRTAAERLDFDPFVLAAIAVDKCTLGVSSNDRKLVRLKVVKFAMNFTRFHLIYTFDKSIMHSQSAYWRMSAVAAAQSLLLENWVENSDLADYVVGLCLQPIH